MFVILMKICLEKLSLYYIDTLCTHNTVIIHVLYCICKFLTFTHSNTSIQYSTPTILHVLVSSI